MLTVATWQQAALTFVRFGIPALAPFLRSDFGLSLGEVGTVIGAFNLGALLVFYPTGRATERLGERLVMGVGAAAVAFACALLVLSPSWVLLALGLALAGVGFPSSQIAGSRAVYRAFDRRGRGLAMGVRQAGLPLGGLLAAVALPWLASRWGWRSAMLAGAAVALSGSLLCALLPAPGRGDGRTAPGLARDLASFLRRRDLLGITGMATLLVVGQFSLMSYLPLYLVDDFRVSKSTAALSLIGVQIGGVVGRLAWGWVSDRFAAGRRTGTLIVISLAGGLCVSALSTGSLAAVFLLALAGGATLQGWNGLYVTLLAERAGAAAATMLSLSMMSLYVAAMFAPPAFGALIEALGYRPAWILLVVPQLLAALLVWSVRRGRPGSLPV
ncbi:MAG TPA: MFS transporter [Gammaproteobacteria bacterium]|nr:MFS transporter [Gammaproteobacteria bacterium]